MSQDTIINNKRIAKNTLVLYVRMFLIMAINLYTSRVVLSVLGVDDFGIYNVVGGVVAMMGLLKGAMSSATTRFITFELGRNNLEQLRKTFSISLVIYMLICLLFLIFSETVGLWFLNTCLTIPPERSVAANWVYQFSLLLVIVEMLSQPYNAVIISHEKMSFYAWVSILEVLFRLGIVYMLNIISYDKLATFGFLMLLSSVIIRLVYGLYCIRFQECRFKIYKDYALFKRMLSYSGWNLFGSASSLVKGQGLNILLNVFFNPAVNAARGIAYQINSAISQFSHNFYTAVRPQITKYYAQNDLSNMFKLVFRSSKFSYYLNLLFSVPLIIEAPTIICLWLGQIPEYVVEFSRLIILISLIDAMAHPLMTSIHSTGHVAIFQTVVGMLNIFNLPISYMFLKWGYTPVIVFYVSLTITIISLFVRLIIVKLYIPSFPVSRYVWEVFGSSLFVTVISFVVPALLHRFLASSLVNMLIVCVVSILTVIFAVFGCGLNHNERAAAIQLVNEKILRR